MILKSLKIDLNKKAFELGQLDLCTKQSRRDWEIDYRVLQSRLSGILLAEEVANQNKEKCEGLFESFKENIAEFITV